MNGERCVWTLSEVRWHSVVWLSGCDSSGNSDEAAFKEAVERATGIPTFVAGEGVRA